MPSRIIVTSMTGSPTYLRLAAMCTGSNNVVPSWTGAVAWGLVYPCNMNAGSIISLGFPFSVFAMVSGFAMLYMMKGWPAGDDTTRWGQRMNKLQTLTQRGCETLFRVMATWATGLAACIFLLFIIVYSSRQRSDSTDGVRMAAGYIIAVALTLAACFIAFRASSTAFTCTARSAMSAGGVGASLRTAFSSGCVTSFASNGLVMFGLVVYYCFMSLGRGRDAYFQYGNRCDTASEFCGQTLGWRDSTGYVYGVACVAIVVKLMAGIYAKAAEVGCELIFKLEGEAASDSLSNPAAVADKAGAIAVDGVASMVDMVESLAMIIISCSILATGIAPRMAIPVWVGTFSFVSAAVASLLVRCSSAAMTSVTARYNSIMWGLRFGMYGNIVVTFFTNAIVMGILYSKYPEQFGGEKEGWKYFSCLLLGMIASAMVWEITSYFTSPMCSPTRSIGAAGITGPSTLLIQGMGVGLISSFPIAFILLFLVTACGAIGGQYGAALGALGFANNVWFAIAANAVSHIAANADATCDSPEIANVRETTVALHMAGESCAAETRGYTISLSVLAAFSCIAAFRQESGVERLSGDTSGEAILFACAICGAFSPIVISGISTLAIGKATRALVDETRRQLQFIVGAGYTECNPDSISSATAYPSALGAFLPVLLSIWVPCTVAFLMGPRCLTTFVTGSCMTGLALSLSLSNAGSAWVKSKTAMEALGSFGGSGSDAHAASLVGARVGSCFKDVASPTMTAVVKMQAITALVVAPLIFIDSNEPYYMTCIMSQSLSGMLPTNCFDWNKAYWGVLPILFLIVSVVVFYVMFWNLDGTPPQKEQPASPRPAAPPAPALPAGFINQPQPQPQQQRQPQQQLQMRPQQQLPMVGNQNMDANAGGGNMLRSMSPQRQNGDVVRGEMYQPLPIQQIQPQALRMPSPPPPAPQMFPAKQHSPPQHQQMYAPPPPLYGAGGGGVGQQYAPVQGQFAQTQYGRAEPNMAPPARPVTGTLEGFKKSGYTVADM